MAALVNASILNAENQNYVRTHGYLETLVKLTVNQNNPKTRQNACWLLKKLVTNNSANRDAARELGIFDYMPRLLAVSETAEVQEHASALLLFLIDKYSRNRNAFRDTAGGPSALLLLYEHIQGSKNKTEQYCLSCIEALGGRKKLKVELQGGTTPLSSKSPRVPGLAVNRNEQGVGGDASKSPHSKKSPRKSPRSPGRFGGKKEKTARKGLFGRSKTTNLEGTPPPSDKGVGDESKWIQSLSGVADEEDPILKGGGGGRRSCDEEEW